MSSRATISLWNALYTVDALQDPGWITVQIQLKYNVKIISYTEKVEVRMRKKALSATGSDQNET